MPLRAINLTALLTKIDQLVTEYTDILALCGEVEMDSSAIKLFFVYSSE